MFQELIYVWSEKADFFMKLLFQHIQISLSAVIIAGILGLLIGICITEYKKSSRIALGIINIVYTIPSISLLGFLIPLSGIGNTTAILALIIYGLLPMVRNTYTGLNDVNPAILEAAKGMGSTKRQLLYKIKLPLALPMIMSGVRNMTVMTIALSGIASFIGAGGLGVAIYRGITTNNKAMTMIGSLLIALLALCLDFILGRIEKALRNRRASGKLRNKVIGIMLFIVCGSLLCSFIIPNKKDSIHIATKPMSEQYVIGEMLKTLIEKETDLEVELTQGIGGGTNNIQPGMLSRKFDIYPEYTGTGWNQVLKKDSFYSEDSFQDLQEEYHKMDLTWQSMLGFNNTFGVVVRKDIAEKYNLKKDSDLTAVADQLVFGAQYDFFEREDGFDALCKKYALTFKDTMDIDNGLKYDAMKEKKIDVMIVYTTDGRLAISDTVMLEDDKQLFASYLCGLVVQEETLDMYPELKTTLSMLSNRISDEDMANMNYQVETLKKEPNIVADEFLKKLGL